MGGELDLAEILGATSCPRVVRRFARHNLVEFESRVNDGVKVLRGVRNDRVWQIEK